MKNFKKIAAVVLALIMCVSTIVPAFAADAACPGEGKTHTVDNCSYEVVSVKAATCEEKGITTYKCNECDTQFATTQASLGAHEYVESIIEPTCTTKGTKTLVCSKCNDIKSEDIDALGHAWEYTWNKDEKNPGICNKGAKYDSRKCATCGVEEGAGVAAGHAWALVEFVEAPTCLTTGKATYACANCDATQVESTVAKLAAHTLVFVKVVSKSTCADDGVALFYCATCGKQIQAANIGGTDAQGNSIAADLKGHKNVTVVVADNTTETTKDDVVAYTCTKNGTKAGDGWCDDCGAYVYNNGGVWTAYNADTLKAAGLNARHTNTETTVGATCTTAGTKTAVCSVCGNIETTTTAVATGTHVRPSEDKITTVTATCTTEGYKLWQCTQCQGMQKTDVVEATGHDLQTVKTWLSNGAAVVDGVVRCGDTIVTKVTCKNDKSEAKRS